MPGKTVAIEEAIYALWLAGAEMALLDDLLEGMGYADPAEAIVRRKDRAAARDEKRKAGRVRGSK